MKSDSFLVKYVIILDGNLSVFLSNSNCNLLDDIKAISTPEKKAEKSKEIIATVIAYCKNTKDYSFGVSKLKVPCILEIEYCVKSGLETNPSPSITSLSVVIFTFLSV